MFENVSDDRGRDPYTERLSACCSPEARLALRIHLNFAEVQDLGEPETPIPQTPIVLQMLDVLGLTGSKLASFRWIYIPL